MTKSENYIVYKHTCPNGKVYIGITMQKPYKRWCGGMGYMQNQHFFRAIVKYGWDNITHEILYEGLSEEQAYETEERLIKEYRSNEFAYGYNQSSGGKYSGAGVHTKRTPSNNPRPKGDMAFNAKRINQYDLDGTFIKTWGSEKSIADYYGLKTASGVSLTCKFKQLAYRGYIWLLEDDANRLPEKLKAIQECSPHQLASLKNWRGSVNAQYDKEKQKAQKRLKAEQKVICQYTLDGKLVAEWSDFKEASNSCGKKSSSVIRDCCNFRKIAAYGYLWVYKREEELIAKKVRHFKTAPAHVQERILEWKKYAK